MKMLEWRGYLWDGVMCVGESMWQHGMAGARSGCHGFWEELRRGCGFGVCRLTLGVMVASSFPPQWREGKREVRTQSRDQVQFSHSVLSDTLRTHGLQHTRPPCPSPTPGVYPNPCPLSWWCHPTISSSVVPFSSRPQSFPASGSFQMSELFASGGQSIGSCSFNISSSNEHSGLISLRMDWLDLLAVQGTLKSLPQHHSSKASILQH